MFCPNCGQRVQDGQKFCDSCGTKLADYLVDESEQENTDGPENGVAEIESGAAEAETGATETETGAAETENGSAEAETDIAEIKVGAPETGNVAAEMKAGAQENGTDARSWNGATAPADSRTENGHSGNKTETAGTEKAGTGSEGSRCDDLKNGGVKELLSLENIELLAAAGPILPFVSIVVGIVIGLVFGLFRFMPFGLGLYYFQRCVKNILDFAVILLCMASVVSAGYVIATDEKCRTENGYSALILLAADVIALIAAFGIPGKTVIALILLVFGLDVISRVMIQKQGIGSRIDPQKDFDAFKGYFDNSDRKQNGKDETRKKAPARSAVSGEQMNSKESYFDGRGIELLGYWFLGGLLIVCTLGIATPWVICMIQKWKKSHTVVDGRRLQFNGRGIELLGRWLLWELLTIVTCGIYSFFVHVAVLKWETKHTFYEGMDERDGEEFPESVFDGNTFEYVGYSIMTSIVTMITCGIGYPWMECYITNWRAQHTRYCGDRLKFDGKGVELFGHYILICILSAVTCGIYAPWGVCRVNNWLASHLSVDRDRSYHGNGRPNDGKDPLEEAFYM